MRILKRCIMASIGLALGRTLFAYLDPGSGSLIVQLLLAAIVGILATFRLWKARLLALFGIRSEPDELDEYDEADADNRNSA